MFKSLGLGVEDLAAAEHVLARAEAEGAGVRSSRCDPARARSCARARCSRHRGADAARAARRGRRRRDLLKLETLQPVNSFKIRGAGNAILQASDEELRDGVVTASAGNMAQGVAYAARLRGVPATIVVPEHAPQTKIDAVERFGGRVIRVPYDEWWQALVEGRYEGAGGLFVHPVDDALVMAGNGTIGLELLEQLARFDAVVVPYGGGGLVTGIASAVKAPVPGSSVYAAEPETGAPVTRRAPAGAPGEVDYTPLVRRRRRQPRADPGRVGARRGLIDGAFACRRGDRCRGAAARRAGARDRRGRRRARGRGGGRGRGRRREGRLHRLGRQHRPGRVLTDPRRRDPVAGRA